MLSHKMEKVVSLSDEEIRKIAISYADYPFSEGEESPFYLLGSREKVINYLSLNIRMMAKSGWVYSLGEHREVFIAFNTKKTALPPFHILFQYVYSSIRLIGLSEMKRFIRQLSSTSSSFRSHKKYKDFIHVQMLSVKPEYQGKGFMRKAMEEVFSLVDEKKIPCILE